MNGRVRWESRAVLVCALAIPSCAQPPMIASPCHSGEIAMTRTVLYFGRSRPGGTVGDVEWRQFVAEIIVPRLPQGFTVSAAQGYWTDHAGHALEEASTLVTILHLPTPTLGQAIAEISAQYQVRFQQESVLREQAPICAHW